MTDPSPLLRPQVERVRLSHPPRLESWDGQGHRSQVELSAWLDHVSDAIGIPSVAGSHQCLVLDVGLPPETPLLEGGRDLDNFLLPVVRRLGASCFTSAWASKRHDSCSWIGITHCDGPRDPGAWSHASATTELSYERQEWKRSVQTQISQQVQHPAPAGPLAVQVLFRVGRGRNWTLLWKPTIDSLGPILGHDPRGRPFRSRDDRIVDPGLHVEEDASLGWRVEAHVWWRPYVG